MGINTFSWTQFAIQNIYLIGIIIFVSFLFYKDVLRRVFLLQKWSETNRHRAFNTSRMIFEVIGLFLLWNAIFASVPHEIMIEKVSHIKYVKEFLINPGVTFALALLMTGLTAGIFYLIAAWKEKKR